MPVHSIWPVETPVGHTCYVTGTGNIKNLVQLSTGNEVHLLQQILYIPNFGRDLFSLTKVACLHKNFTLCKDHTFESIQDSQLIMIRHMCQGSFILDFTIIFSPAIVSYAASYGNTPSSEELQDLYSWHLRLSHLHYDMIKRMASNGSVIGIKLKNIDPPSICSGCAFGKSHRNLFLQNITRTRASLFGIFLGIFLYSDICSPMSVPSYGGSLYYILFQDDCTRYRFVFFFLQKSNALIYFLRACKTILCDTGHKVLTLRTDNGGKYCSKFFIGYLHKKTSNMNLQFCICQNKMQY